MRTISGFMALSLILLFACNSKEEPADGGMVSEEEETGDGDGDNPGDGDGAPGDGDGDPGDGDGDSTSFIPTDDIPSAASCDPLAQDCPDGEKCVPYSSMGGTWDANKCVAVKGSGTSGDQCVYDGAATGSDNCDAQHICWNALDVDGMLVGTCFPFCTGSVDNPMCDDADKSCRVVNDGVITICLPNCDPLLQECDPGLGCYWSGGSGTFQCIITAGGIPTGEPCGYNNDCNPGHFCADASLHSMCNGSACCAVFCDLTDEPDPCPSPHECVPFFDEGQAPPMYTDLGLCILPP